MTDDRPTRRKYARTERERRFLLKKLPNCVEPGDFKRLRDCYVAGARLRLRRVEDPCGELLIVKLGRKEPDPEAPADPTRQIMTTLYLQPEEYDGVSALTGVQSVKRRYRLTEDDRTFIIDAYEEPPEAVGVIIAEVEHDTDAELMAVPVPSWSDREVTADPSWSAFAISSRGLQDHKIRKETT